MTFLVHGEPVAMEALAGVHQGQARLDTMLPEHEESVELVTLELHEARHFN